MVCPGIEHTHENCAVRRSYIAISMSINTSRQGTQTYVIAVLGNMLGVEAGLVPDEMRRRNIRSTLIHNVSIALGLANA